MKITPKFIIQSLFNLLILTLPLYFRFVNEELFEFNKMILVYGFTAVIATAWGIRMIGEKKLILKRTPFDYVLILFVFSQLVSTLFSIHPYTSFYGYYSRFNGGFLSTLSYVTLFYAFVSNFSKKELGSFLFSTFLSGLLVSIYGILEHFGHSISCLLVPGGKTFGVDCWVQDVQSRVYASFGQPNWLAAYVITLFPLSLVASIQKKLSFTKRILFSLTTLSFFAVLLFTRSRSGMLGLVIGGVVFSILLGLLFIKNKTLTKKINLPTTASLTGIIVLIAVFFGTSFTPSISEIFSKTQATSSSNPATQEETLETPSPVTNRLEEGGTDSGEIRKIVWEGAYKVWQRYPLIGSGVETFAYSYYQDRTREHNDVSEWDFLYNKAHNEILNYLATTGLIGTVSYLLLFVVFSTTALKIIFNSKNKLIEKLIVIALASGLSALFISNFFGFSTVTVNVLMYCFFGFTSLIYKEELKANKSSIKSSKTDFVLKDGWQYFAVTVVILTGLILVSKTYNYWAADVAYSTGKTLLANGQYQPGIQKQLEAIQRRPNEALYFDTLSDNYAKLAVHLASINETTAAAQLTQETIFASDQVMKLNNRHLNFYKTRARVFVTLSQLNEEFIEEAKTTLLEAEKISPTDPKIIYTLAVIEQTTGNAQKGLELYEKALELKPNYERPYWKISEIYEAQNNYEEAIKPLQFILDSISPNNEKVIEKITELQKNLK